MDPFNTRNIDIDIEDARTKKKTVDMKMDSIMSLMREVESREKAAQKAKQEVDNCTLEIMAEINDLVLQQRRLKEINDKRAREVYARKANLATEMNALLYRLSGVLTQGDECLATIDEMYKSLEKRLTCTIKQKEAADKEKLQKEATLAYQRNQMKKLVEESKKLEQQAIENIKLQELITDRGHEVNMLYGEISYKYEDVKRIKYELGDYQERSEISDCVRPLIPGMLPSQKNCESYKIVQSPIPTNYPEFIGELVMELLDEDTDARNDHGPTTTLVRSYQETQMEKSVQESKPQEQQKAAHYNIKEFLKDYGHLVNMSELKDYGHLVNMSREEMTWKCQDVKLPKQELDDSKDANVVVCVTEDYSMPIIQETLPIQDCENKCSHSIFLKKGVKGRTVAASGKETMRKNKIIKSRMINSKTKDMKKWILGQITEAIADHEDINFA